MTPCCFYDVLFRVLLFFFAFSFVFFLVLRDLAETHITSGGSRICCVRGLRARCWVLCVRLLFDRWNLLRPMMATGRGWNLS